MLLDLEELDDKTLEELRTDYEQLARDAKSRTRMPPRAQQVPRKPAGIQERPGLIALLAFFFGTFLPFFRARDRPMARALLPLFKVPRFFLCIARLTSFEADFEYLRATS